MNKKLNKKLLKSILCIASGVAIATSIPFTTTSCGSSSSEEEINPLPDEVYNIDENNVLRGFTQEFLDNPSAYGERSVMQIPARVRYVADNAFFIPDSSQPTSTIPSFITKLTFAEGSNCSTIGSYAFGLSPFTSATLPDGLTTLNYASFGFSKLTSITLPNNLNTISSGTFMNCSALESVVFPNNLSLIETDAFDNCPLLSEVDLLNSTNLTSIGEYAFNHCSSLTSVSFPKSLSVVESSAFNNCSNLSSITWDAWNGNTTLQSSSFSGVCPDGGTVTVTNPSGYSDIDLLSYLVENAGLPESWLPQGELPESVYRIENNILKGFTSEFLANPSAYRLCDTMEIPANVTSIEESAFIDDPTAEQPNSTIPSFITKLTFAKESHCFSVGAMAFNDCQSLTSIKFPSSLQSIGEEAFHRSSALVSIDFSNATNLSRIDGSAFSSCSSLTSIDLSKCNKLNSMESYTFYYCNTLKSIKIPSNLTIIPAAAFGKCSALTSVDLSNATSLSSINGCAFEYCSSLTSVSLPESLNEIGNSAFWRCRSLRSINFPNNLSLIGNSVFYNCFALTSISLPSNLSTIGYEAFNNCLNLSSIRWDAWNGNTTLQSSSFSGVYPDGGTVTVTNPTDDNHNSEALLNYLLDNGGLPQSWAKVNPLPEEVYEFSEDGKTLLGFTNEFLADPTAYDMYNTMEIPARVTSIGKLAFYDYQDSSSTIPSFITRLTFEENSNCGSIGNNTFQNCSSLTSVNLLNCQNLSSINNSAFSFCSALTSVRFPSSLIEIQWSIFDICPNLSSIRWDRWTGSFNFLAPDAFSRVCPTGGTVTVINPIDDAHNSAALLAHLKQNSGLPESWIVA